jgi:hypothetical protein
MDELTFYTKINNNISAGPSSILKVVLIYGAKVKKNLMREVGIKLLLR